MVSQQIFSNGIKNQPEENRPMAGRNTTQTIITAEEALRTEIILNQALIDILISKGFICEDELISKIQKIRREREMLTGCWDIST